MQPATTTGAVPVAALGDPAVVPAAAFGDGVDGSETESADDDPGERGGEEGCKPEPVLALRAAQAPQALAQAAPGERRSLRVRRLGVRRLWVRGRGREGRTLGAYGLGLVGRGGSCRRSWT